jgi:hypothetical protein
MIAGVTARHLLIFILLFAMLLALHSVAEAF